MKASHVAAALLLTAMAGPACAQEALPPGPYQLTGLTFATIGATFDPQAVKAALPPNVEAVDGFTGGFNLYTAPNGWGLAPFSAGYIWVDVKGHEGTMGPARYFLAAFYSDKAFEWLAPLGVAEGSVTHENEAGVVTSAVVVGGSPAITISLETNDATCAPISGVNHYLAGPGADGLSALMFLVPFTETFCEAKPLSVDISAPALAAFKPLSLQWAGYATEGSITLGISEPLAK